MIMRIVLGALMALVAIGACVFVAGNLDPFSWPEGGRFITVFIVFSTLALTVTCPYFGANK